MLKDLYIFDHFMNHTSGRVEVLELPAYALEVGIPLLAAEDKGILCSVMALGAACLCVDILLGDQPSHQVSDINELINSGDWYHQQGLHIIRHQMSSRHLSQLEIANMHASLLFPYSLARRRISRLLGGLQHNYPLGRFEAELDGFQNKEWIVLLRGIITTGMACWSNESILATGTSEAPRDESEKTDPVISSYIMQAVSEKRKERLSRERIVPPALGSRHALFPIINSTRRSALEALQGKIDLVSQTIRAHHRKEMPMIFFPNTRMQLAQSGSLVACGLALDILVGIADLIFADPPRVSLEEILAESSLPPGDEPSKSYWIRGYLGKRPICHPALPLTRVIFAWISRVPAEYMDVLTQSPPIAARVDPNSAGALKSPDIDREIQLLAWDIYAHWMTFAILLEDEKWWMADLGVTEITQLRVILDKRSNCSPKDMDTTEEGQDWWPWNMCSITQQLKKYK
jgi:hypothetical protein